MTNKALVALFVLALVFALGANEVIETGPPRAGEWLLGAGDLVTVGDSIPNWVGVTSMVIVNQSASVAAEVGFYSRSGWTSIGVDGGATLSLPVEFMSPSRIASAAAGAHPDSVVHCASGAVRVYLLGG